MNIRSFTRFLSALSCFFVLFYCASCARLPDYAQPHMSNQPFDETLGSISYRQLSREDFKAEAPSSTIHDHQHMINAHTSVSLRPVHDIGHLISPPHLNFGLYRVYLQDLGFKAVMIPERSWWNPGLTQSKVTYVLQHEQIHFALMEISARKVNKKFAAAPSSSISAPEKHTLLQRVKELIDKEIDESRKEILKEHTAFDEQTSLYHDPARQQEWYDDCQKQLLQLQRWAK